MPGLHRQRPLPLAGKDALDPRAAIRRQDFTFRHEALVPPHHEGVPELMGDLEKFWHNEAVVVPHLVRVAISHYQFETIHPFLDGNGRIGRLMIPLYLISHGLLAKPSLYLSDFFERNRASYYDALMRVRTSNDLIHWVRFFLNGVTQTAVKGRDTFRQILSLRTEVEHAALDMGRRGDADVLFVHDQVAEDKLVADGFGVRRLPVMYNDFVLIGPKADPAGTRGKDIVEALKKLSAANAPFVSRGDKSGTHAAELRYWALAGAAERKGSGYRECGCGMGPALNIGASSGAYVLADRGTLLNFRTRGELAILVEGDTRLFNQYGVIAVNPAKHPHVKAADAQKFVDWVVSPAGQGVIAGYKIGGEQLFFPNATK